MKYRLTRGVFIAPLLLIIMLAGNLLGCSGTVKAYETAENIGDTAKIVGEHYFAIVQEANQLKKSGALNGNELEEAQNLVRNTRPAIDALAAAGEIYEATANGTTEAELAAAISKTSAAVAKLMTIVKSAGSSSRIDAANLRGLPA